MKPDLIERANVYIYQAEQAEKRKQWDQVGPIDLVRDLRNEVIALRQTLEEQRNSRKSRNQAH